MDLTDLKVARSIAAKPEAIFDVWMDPNSPGSIWYGAEGAIVNASVGGLFYWLVRHEGKRWPHYGRFLRIERPAHGGAGVVEMTWMSQATRGEETVVTTTFQPLGEETEVTLTHTGVPDDEMGRTHEAGWTWMLNTLAERFSVHEEA
jgi:uncharacterized protein YndB with AHSA1/START domain